MSFDIPTNIARGSNFSSSLLINIPFKNYLFSSVIVILMSVVWYLIDFWYTFFL